MLSEKIKKIISGGILFITILLASFFVRIYPLVKKGYTPTIEDVGLVRAKNLHKNGSLYLEGANHIILSSSQIQNEGVYANTTNELTSLFYSKVFDYFGFNEKLPMYVCVGIWAIISLLLFVLVWHLFELKIALLFSILEIFIPFTIQGALRPCFYELGVLFFTIGLMFYLWKNKQTWQELILASIFMSFAFLSRNSFILSLIAIFIYDIFKHKSLKRVLLIIVPFLVLSTLFIYPNFQRGIGNSFLTSSTASQTFDRLGHLFPDPYIYHFDKINYLEGIKNTTEPNFVEYLTKYGYSTTLKAKILTYINSLEFYPERLIKIIIIGGPIFIGFLFAGLIWLQKNKKDIFVFLLSWISLWYLLLIILKTNNWDHFLEIIIPLILPICLGIYWLIKSILKYVDSIFGKRCLAISFSLLLIGQMALSTKWMLHEQYATGMDKTLEYAKIMNQVKGYEGFKQNAITAVGTHPGTPYYLNYFTDQNYVYISPDTIVDLLEKGTIDNMIKKMNISYFIGYGENMSNLLYQNNYPVLLP